MKVAERAYRSELNIKDRAGAVEAPFGGSPALASDSDICISGEGMKMNFEFIKIGAPPARLV